jgi:hypothetical protein
MELGGQHPFLEHCLLLEVGKVDLYKSTAGGQTLHLLQRGDQIGAIEIVDGVEGEDGKLLSGKGSALPDAGGPTTLQLAMHQGILRYVSPKARDPAAP